MNVQLDKAHLDVWAGGELHASLLDKLFGIGSRSPTLR